MIVELDADRRRAVIDDEIDAAAQVGQHVRGGGRRDVAGAIGRRRHHRLAEGGKDFPRDAVAGNPHRDGLEARSRKLRNRAPRRLGQDERQRPRPEHFRKAFRIGIEDRQRPRGRNIGNMRDQGIERRPAFGLVKTRDRLSVGRIGAKAVNSLGREGDEAAGLEAMHRVADRSRVGPRNACDQRGCHRREEVPKWQ